MNHRVISCPDFFDEEADLINALFEADLRFLHLRKPQASFAECQALLSAIHPDFYPRIITHQYPGLIDEFSLGGFHFKEHYRNSLSEIDLSLLISSYHEKHILVGTSVHQKSTLLNLKLNFDYILLSPVFPSISKPGYLPTEDWIIKDLSLPSALVALGGVNYHNITTAQKKGFKEVAFLGAVWNEKAHFINNYDLLCRKMKNSDPSS